VQRAFQSSKILASEERFVTIANENARECYSRAVLRGGQSRIDTGLSHVEGRDAGVEFQATTNLPVQHDAAQTDGSKYSKRKRAGQLGYFCMPISSWTIPGDKRGITASDQYVRGDPAPGYDPELWENGGSSDLCARS
jgi:hypothetical protein